MPAPLLDAGVHDSAQARTAVVVGAGVIGLTVAHELRSHGWKVHVVARDQPEDVTSQGFASPWAGANWCSYADARQTRVQMWERETFRRFGKIAQVTHSNVLALLPFEHIVHHDVDAQSLWWRDVVKNFRLEYPDARRFPVVRYDSWCIDVPNYTRWLVQSLKALPDKNRPDESADGSSWLPAWQANAPPVSFHRCGTLRSLEDALHCLPRSARSHVKVLVNATALGSRWLTDVRDERMVPARGVVCLVRAPKVQRCYIDPGALNLHSIPAPKGSLPASSSSACPVASDLSDAASCSSSGSEDEDEVARARVGLSAKSNAGRPTYVIPRALSGDIILGGTFDQGWQFAPSPPGQESGAGGAECSGGTENDVTQTAHSPSTTEARVTAEERRIADDILRDCVELCPELRRGEYELLSVNVGFRPVRQGGARVEWERERRLPLEGDGGHLLLLDDECDGASEGRCGGGGGGGGSGSSSGADNKVTEVPSPPSSSTPACAVVHAYGHGPAGYQQSWGVAQEVRCLVEEAYQAIVSS